MLDLTFHANIEDIIGNLTELEHRQVPFAMMAALNRTADLAVGNVRADMPNRFTLRNNWLPKGIRVSRSTKNRLIARIYTLDKYMEHHEVGGVRRPTKSGSLFIPSLNVREGGVIEGRIIKGMRPSTLFKAAAKAEARKRKTRKPGVYRKPLAFLAPMAGGRTGMFIREQAESRLPIRLLYTLADSVTLRPRWGFNKTVTATAERVLRWEFIKSLDKGLRSARGGPVKSPYVEHLLNTDGASQGSASSMLGGSVLSGMQRSSA